MLRIVVSKSAEAAKRYFRTGLQRGDYYLAGDELGVDAGGVWGGQGAELLGLRGPAELRVFDWLVNNMRPDGSGPLTSRTKSMRRSGFDCVFSAPKSVSIDWAATGDLNIVRALEFVATETMQLAERDARTRVRVGGANDTRVSGNLTWARFTHTTTRPIDGVPDPHLHCHVFVFNATFDSIENRWKAVDLGAIKQAAPYYEAVFHSRLAARLQELGYEIRQEGRSFELAHVTERAIREFSRRTEQINKKATELGISKPETKAKLGATTRHSKSASLSASEVRSNWAGRLTEAELSAIRTGKSVSRQFELEVNIDALMTSAVENGLKYRSLTTDKQLIDEVLRIGIGRVQADEAHAALERSGTKTFVVNGKPYRTTPESQESAQRILASARDGRGRMSAFGSSNGSRIVPSGPSGPLTRKLLESQDRVTLLRSRGHRFNERVEKELAGELMARGEGVTFVSGDKLQGKDSGAKGRTVRNFLDDRLARQAAEGRTLWVRSPESVPLRDMAELFDTAARLRARVVLAASRWPSASPVPGDVLAALERHAGLGPAQRESDRVSRARRRETYEDFKQGRGINPEAWGRDGCIHMERAADVLKAAGRAFVAAVKDRKSPLIVSLGDPLETARAVRKAMEEAKLLKGGRRVQMLVRAPFNDEQRADPRVYRRGEVVQFYKPTKGFRPGMQYTVLGHDPFGNVMVRNGMFLEALPLSKSDHYGLFRKSTLMLRKGDFIRVTCDGRTKNERFGLEKLLSERRQAVRLANHKLFGIKSPDRRYRVPRDSHHRVTGFTRKGDIKLDNGWVLPANFGHLEYGYCVTNEQRAIGSFGRVLMVDVPSAGGRLPSLSGLVCEHVPELHIISADPDAIRPESVEKEPDQRFADEASAASFERTHQRSSERHRETECVREEFGYER